MNLQKSEMNKSSIKAVCAKFVKCIWPKCGKIHEILPFHNEIQIAYCSKHQKEYREKEAEQMELDRAIDKTLMIFHE